MHITGCQFDILVSLANLEIDCEPIDYSPCMSPALIPDDGRQVRLVWVAQQGLVPAPGSFRYGYGYGVVVVVMVVYCVGNDS